MCHCLVTVSNKHCFKQPFLLDIYLFYDFSILDYFRVSQACFLLSFHIQNSSRNLDVTIQQVCNYPANYIALYPNIAVPSICIRYDDNDPPNDN